MHEDPDTVGPPPAPSPELAPQDAAGEPVVLEREERLSRSLLWNLQRGFFERKGIEAWRTNTVPHYITSNPAIAHAYAEVVLGLLRDLRAGGPLDPAEAVTIVELGAGSGRFAYLFLRAFLRLRSASSLAGVRVRYVLTDFTEKNVAFARAHDALRPFVEEGVLDFAVLDVERDGEIRLLGAGAALGPGSLRHPLVVIANYVFDGIPQDAFGFCGGALHEMRVTLRGREDSTDLESIGKVHAEYTLREAPLDYYGDPDLDGTLRDYARRLDGETFLFPVAAIRCLSRLAALASGRLLLLSGDKGMVDEKGLTGVLGMAFHGSFSMLVNYHAIGAYAERRGGRALKPPRPQRQFMTVAVLLGEHPSGYAETRAAYGEVFERTDPFDLHALRLGMHENYGQHSLNEIAALMRLLCYDPHVLADCVPALSEKIAEASPAARQELVQLVTESWANYYPFGEPHDTAFDFALLLHRLGEPRAALALFAESVRLHGDDPRTLWNMGICHFKLGEAEEATRRFNEATRKGFVPEGVVR